VPQVVLAATNALVAGGGLGAQRIFKHEAPAELVDALMPSAGEGGGWWEGERGGGEGSVGPMGGGEGVWDRGTKGEGGGWVGGWWVSAPVDAHAHALHR
jgi:hypothetical protein